MTKDNMVSSLDLGSAKRGKSFHTITKANLTLPNERIDIVNIFPPRIEVVVEKAPKPETQEKQPNPEKPAAKG